MQHRFGSRAILIGYFPTAISNGFNDDYYLSIGSEPPRFAQYRRKRIEQSTDQYGKKTLLAAYDSITQALSYFLDYSLKRQLRMTPEQRYQKKKANFLFQ